MNTIDLDLVINATASSFFVKNDIPVKMIMLFDAHGMSMHLGKGNYTSQEKYIPSIQTGMGHWPVFIPFIDLGYNLLELKNYLYCKRMCVDAAFIVTYGPTWFVVEALYKSDDSVHEYISNGLITSTLGLTTSDQLTNSYPIPTDLATRLYPKTLLLTRFTLGQGCFVSLSVSGLSDESRQFWVEKGEDEDLLGGENTTNYIPLCHVVGRQYYFGKGDEQNQQHWRAFGDQLRSLLCVMMGETVSPALEIGVVSMVGVCEKLQISLADVAMPNFGKASSLDERREHIQTLLTRHKQGRDSSLSSIMEIVLNQFFTKLHTLLAVRFEYPVWKNYLRDFWNQ